MNELDNLNYSFRRNSIEREIGYYLFTMSNHERLVALSKQDSYIINIPELQSCELILDALRQDLLILDTNHELGLD